MATVSSFLPFKNPFLPVDESGYIKEPEKRRPFSVPSRPKLKKDHVHEV
jgi:hypothetical protein